MWTKMPKIANIQCHRLRFEKGDKIIVRVYGELSQEQKHKLRDSVQKWAGDVEVLIVDTRKFDIEVEKACQKTKLFVP